MSRRKRGGLVAALERRPPAPRSVPSSSQRPLSSPPRKSGTRWRRRPSPAPRGISIMRAGRAGLDALAAPLAVAVVDPEEPDAVRRSPPRRGRGRGRQCRRDRSGRTCRAAARGGTPPAKCSGAWRCCSPARESAPPIGRFEVAERRGGPYRQAHRGRGGSDGPRRAEARRWPRSNVRTFASTTSGCLRENVARIVSRTASGSTNGQRADDRTEHRRVHTRPLLDRDAECVERRRPWPTPNPSRSGESSSGARGRVDDHRASGCEAGDRRSARLGQSRMEDRDQLRPSRSGLLTRIGAAGCAEAHEGLHRGSLLLRAVRGEVRAVQALPQHAGLRKHLAGEMSTESTDRLEPESVEAVRADAISDRSVHVQTSASEPRPPLRGRHPGRHG